MTGGAEPDRAEAFETFFEAEHGRLFRVLCLVTGDTGEAEELMQEAFLRVWERWDRVRAHVNPSGYLYRTALNLSRNRLRQLAHGARHLFPFSGGSDALARVEDRETLLPALKRLTRRQRAALLLTEVMDLKSEEAAEILSVKPVTVRVLASQARAALRRSMEAIDG